MISDTWKVRLCMGCNIYCVTSFWQSLPSYWGMLGMLWHILSRVILFHFMVRQLKKNSLQSLSPLLLLTITMVNICWSRTVFKRKRWCPYSKKAACHWGWVPSYKQCIQCYSWSQGKFQSQLSSSHLWGS